MTKTLLAIALSAAMGAHAQTVGVHLVSVHAHSGRTSDPGAIPWNNVNPGLYLRTDNGLTVGRFYNSYRMWSNYAGWTFGDQWALTVGAVTGYDKMVNSGGDYTATRCDPICRDVQLKKVIAPLLVPSVKLPLTDKAALRFSLLVNKPTALHLSMEARF